LDLINEKGLKILTKESPISLFEGKTLNPCKYYLFDKHHKASFHKHLKKKENNLELIYADVCGAIEAESLYGDRYLVTFINDTSLKPWVYMLKAKIQVF